MRRWTLKLTMPVGSGSSYPFGSHPLIAECSVTQSTDEVGASVGHHAIVAHVLTDGTVDDAPIGLELIDVVDDDLASVTADGVVLANLSDRPISRQLGKQEVALKPYELTTVQRR